VQELVQERQAVVMIHDDCWQ